jgi:hypothetical protein
MVWYGRYRATLLVFACCRRRIVSSCRHYEARSIVSPPNNLNPIGTLDQPRIFHTPIIVLTMPPPIVRRRRDDAFLLSFQTNYETIAVVDASSGPHHDCLATVRTRRVTLPRHEGNGRLPNHDNHKARLKECGPAKRTTSFALPSSDRHKRDQQTSCLTTIRRPFPRIRDSITPLAPLASNLPLTV